MDLSEELRGAIVAAAALLIRETVALYQRRRKRTEPPPSIPYRAPLPSLHSARPRVLVIEDDMASARGAARLLTQDGYEVDVAHTAEEARHLAALTTYRVVLGDLLLGEGGDTGSALLAELRERQRLRIVVYSGGSPEMLAAVRRELGPDAVVEKPDVQEMLAAVRAAVGD